MNSYEKRLERFKAALKEADAVLIGAGAGLSAAAGLTYSGPRFENNFSEYIARYGLTDMYSAGFYPYPSEEAKWAYWSKHIDINRYQPGATKLYKQLRKTIGEKPYFVITTNVDGQFEASGFATDNGTGTTCNSDKV